MKLDLGGCVKTMVGEGQKHHTERAYMGVYWGKERESGERKGVQSGLMEEKEIEKEGKKQRDGEM